MSGKVKCLEMGHRLDLVPDLSSSGFEKVFPQEFLMSDPLKERRDEESSCVRDVCLGRDLSSTKDIAVPGHPGCAQSLLPALGRQISAGLGAPLLQQLNPSHQLGCAVCRRDALSSAPFPISCFAPLCEENPAKITFLLQYSATSRTLARYSAGFQAHPNVINVF